MKLLKNTYGSIKKDLLLYIAAGCFSLGGYFIDGNTKDYVFSKVGLESKVIKQPEQIQDDEKEKSNWETLLGAYFLIGGTSSLVSGVDLRKLRKREEE